MSRVRVNSERTYDVFIGARWFDELAIFTANRLRVAVIHSQNQRDEVHEKVSGDKYSFIEIPDGELGKTPEVLLKIIHRLGELGFTRSDLIVGIGGGAVTDISGFAAATWLRGIDWISIPTTIAGAVDAAIGGKTGCNTEHGKNLFGAFHSPIGVLVDLDWFTSLTDRDFSAGLAEVIKCGFIKDPSILELMAGKKLEEVRTNKILLEYLIRKAVSVKAEVVSQDFRESEGREILNYGHTFGHAIEKLSNYEIRHGEAVSIGLIFAAELAFSRGLISEDIVQSHRNFLQSLNLPITYPGGKWSQIEPLLAIDKKSRGKQVRFVALTGLGTTSRIEDSTSDELKAIYERVAE